jgi:hypothetical protein
MARKKGPPASEVSRDDNKKFSDRRFKNGMEGAVAKEKKAIEEWNKTHKA